MISREALAQFGGSATAQGKPASGATGFDMEGYLTKHGFKVIRRKPWNSRPGGMIFELERCPFNPDHTGGSAALTFADGVPGFACKHNGCDGKTIKDVFANYPPERPPRVEVADEWPDPAPLGGVLRGVESFVQELLPASFRAHVTDVAERMQVPPDFPAAATVICLAGAVNRRAMIQPKMHDTGWKVVPNLWGAIVGRPGFKKTPVIESITHPLKEIQKIWFQAHEDAQAEYQEQRELHELKINAWKQQTTQALKAGRIPPERPTELRNLPTCQRLIVTDATFEALHRSMSENPAGVLVLRDELTGWLAQLDKPGREGERAFCLEAWNGTSGFTVDRIERGTIHVPHVCMSLLGGIQPGRLRSYLSDALESGPGDDGLIQRFQVLVWPDLPANWKMVDRAPDRFAEDQVASVYRRLVELSPESPVLFQFSREAQELFFDWYAELQAKVRGGNLHDALAAHLGKYGSLMPSLALLFELADQAAAGAWTSEFVSLEHTKQAAAFCDYFESHARRMYGSVISPQMRAAADLSERIKRLEVGRDGLFSVRDVYRAEWAGLNTPERADAAVSILADLGWIREMPAPSSGPRGGRHASPRYQVNPKAMGRA
jgi:putative DNA primase/helicase